MFIIVRNGKRVVYQDKIIELSIKEITIKTIKKYELVQITEIIEISLGVDPLTFLIDDILLTMAMKQKIIFDYTKVSQLMVVTTILFLK